MIDGPLPSKSFSPVASRTVSCSLGTPATGWITWCAHGDQVRAYSASLRGVGMLKLAEQYAHARALVADGSARDLRRGFTYTFLLLTGTIWIVSFLALVYVAHRISHPIQQLTGGLVASSRRSSGLPGSTMRATTKLASLSRRSTTWPTS